jgi:hypothetical protein
MPELAESIRDITDTEERNELSTPDDIAAGDDTEKEWVALVKPFTFAELDAIDWDVFDWENYDLEKRLIVTLDTLRLDMENALLLLRQHQRISMVTEADKPYGGDMWRLHRDLFLRRFRQGRDESEHKSEDVTPGEIRTLVGIKTGLYEITTKNGMRYVLNLDTETIIRHPPEGRKWGDPVAHYRQLWTDTGEKSGLFEVTTESGLRYTVDLDTQVIIHQGWDDSGLFTSDKQVVHYQKLWNATVGESMVLESNDEWWASAAVKSIKHFDNFSTPVND